MRKPDEVTWMKPTRCFAFGWDYQKYWFNASTFSFFLGFVVLRWHRK